MYIFLSNGLCQRYTHASSVEYGCNIADLQVVDSLELCRVKNTDCLLPFALYLNADRTSIAIARNVSLKVECDNAAFFHFSFYY